ncbi:arylsulfatase [Novosphingobium mangrovi (ex Hu et al. 2023)]|uniref:Arylsulfatase n=1 Tax=Novosphingobium mangrovi (ex Hu et al. 2023) TaxID=2930094 RepID=A0ABT0A7V9_9SPHN|nr:arylsulfatase [Novosphingobium mangrovi (ex Hu et al. 2023)]MCJ1959286.1 arylsulfatase [Novosphingobium mangrovi (ex Hu et al. 2023)]
MIQLSRRRFAGALLAGTMLAGQSRAATRQAPRTPNIVTIVLDDIGFSDLGCFGGEISTPHIDALAKRGVRYNRFDTKAVCSTTRAALLTGRNGHSVNFPDVPDTNFGPFAERYDADAFRLPDDIQTTAEVLQDGGYATWLLGKWHLIPSDELEPGTSRRNWPRQRGFDYFYGFAKGWTDQYRPDLVENDDYIDPDLPSDYHFSVDMADKAMALVSAHVDNGERDRPFFLQMGMGVAHSPIQAPAEFSARYANRYRRGWDIVRGERFARMKEMGLIPANCTLPPREEDDRAWDELSEDEQLVFARYMEVYAGFIEHADAQIGRLVEHLRSHDLLENTLILVLSDNGAASEAGQRGFFEGLYQANTLTPAEQRARMIELGTVATQSEYPRPWASASSAPFRRYKLWPFLGGVRTALIVSWPAHVRTGGAIREQYVDVIDVGPTLLDAAGLDFAPTVNGTPQRPVAGRSFLRTLNDAQAPGRQRQFFELRGNRAITDGNWRAVALHDCASDTFAHDQWQLFNTAEDFAEAHDLAASHPQKLAEMQRLWHSEWTRWVGPELTPPPASFCMLAGDMSVPH